MSVRNASWINSPFAYSFKISNLSGERLLPSTLECRIGAAGCTNGFMFFFIMLLAEELMVCSHYLHACYFFHVRDVSFFDVSFLSLYPCHQEHFLQSCSLQKLFERRLKKR
ncbi:hypothetical protein BVwin_12300 [Bartonella vinsonii subsp. berkhoffii str. Winnie]|nr:hypothetical protein BVwin_12300 [Bartonella vinsonii subsp. berkhoffii str. Winnie]